MKNADQNKKIWMKLFEYVLFDFGFSLIEIKGTVESWQKYAL